MASHYHLLNVEKSNAFYCDKLMSHIKAQPLTHVL
jgi:hypothetical protein